MNLEHFVVRRARWHDWEAIVAMRDAFYMERKLPIQERPDATWLVCEFDGAIVACEAYSDNGSQRWQTDFYRVPGRYGTIGAARMMEFVEDLARSEGMVALAGFTVDERNYAAALKHGWLDGGRMIYKPLTKDG